MSNSSSFAATVSQLLGISKSSYYNWKNERPIIQFLEKYFDEKELQEYILTGRIQKLENLKNINLQAENKFLTETETAIIDETIINLKLSSMDRRSLLYLLYLLKKMPEVSTFDRLQEHFQKQLKSSRGTLLDKIKDFGSKLKFSKIDEHNVSFPAYIQLFAEDIQLYLNPNEVNYILGNPQYFDTILTIANRKL